MRWIWMLGAAASLSACGNGVPTGQVVATVNGDEITRAEVNAALSGNAPSDPKDAARARSAVLEQLIAQHVIVQEAKREDLDKSQPYLLATRRAEAQILTELMTRRVFQGLRSPDDATLDKYIAANPTRFANRVIFQTDQVRASAGSIDPQTLKNEHTLDGILARLRAVGAQTARASVPVDSAGLPPAVTRELQSLPAGEPFVTVENGMLLASVIVSAKSVPLDGDQARKIAVNLIKQDIGSTALKRQYDTLRKNAEVHYQAGFAPPTTTPSPAGSKGTSQ